jgi:hypothetical protein
VPSFATQAKPGIPFRRAGVAPLLPPVNEYRMLSVCASAEGREKRTASVAANIRNDANAAAGAGFQGYCAFHDDSLLDGRAAKGEARLAWGKEPTLVWQR